MADEHLGDRPNEVAQKAINFLSKARTTDLQTLKIKNRTIVLVNARRVLHKYTLLNSVREKMKEIKDVVEQFKGALTPLFRYGLPCFWDDGSKLIAESEYKEMMIKARSYHSKFKNMVKGLKGTVVVNKMRKYFELPILFRKIRSKLPIFT